MLPDILTPIPGPHSIACAERLRRYESQNVTYLGPGFPIFWDRAEGVNVWDVDGNRFLDLTSAFAVAGLGHGNAQVKAALDDQASRLWHGMGDVHPTELKANLCQELSRLTYERWTGEEAKTILCNSGFEAIEAALKTAFLKSGKPGVISFQNGYHGLGYGALTVTGLTKFQTPFTKLLPAWRHELPFPGPEDDLRPILDRLTHLLSKHDIGAVLMEPIQARGGKIVPPPGFLTQIQEMARAAGALLILDEIYTGFNRTGALFACEHEAVAPDLICVGKALTSGFPLSACIGTASLMDAAWPPSTGEALHTSTFLGNPLGCAMGLAALEQHADPQVARTVQGKGALFRHYLETLGTVRGRGLMLGLEINTPSGEADGCLAAHIITEGLKHGLILLADGPQGNVIALSPPFEISDAEMEYTVDTLGKLLKKPTVG